MVMKFVVLFVVIPLITCSGPTDFHPEEQCSAVGGNCIKSDECPTPIEYLNHCPQQRDQGAECCHGVSTKEYRCQRFGGSCVADGTRCPDSLRRPQATDCPAGQFCCIFV